MPVRARFASTFLISACLVVGLFLLALPALYLLIPGVPLEPFPEQHQDAETLLYLLFFFVLFPAGIFAGPRIADRFATRHSSETADLLSALLLGSLALAVITVRLSDLVGVERSLVMTGLVAAAWWVLALLLYFPGSGFVASLAGRTDQRTVWIATAALCVLALATAVTFSGLDGPVLIGGLMVAGIVTWVWGRLTIPVLSGWKGLLFDLVLVVVFLFAVVDVPIYRIGEFAEAPMDEFLSEVQQFHAALWLAAANAIEHGRYLPVDTASQYGVGSIYFIAGVFELIPMDYGTLSLLDAVLAALVYAMGWAIMRMAGVGRALSAGVLLLILPVLVWGTTYPVGGILQNGSIRFGLLPFCFIFLRMLSLWKQRWSKPFGLLAWAVVGVSAIWALEGLLYTTGAVLGMVAVEAAVRNPGTRRSWLTGQALRFVAAWAVVHVLFAIFTLIVAGSLPDWGLYLSYLREFLTGDIGDLTYDYAPFSPALPVALAYLLSGLLLALIALRKREWLLENRLALIAIGGLTFYGIFQYSYFDNRSLAGILPFVSFPLVLIWAIWLDLLLRTQSLPDLVKRSALAGTLGLAAVAVAVAWPAASQRVGDTALVWAMPGGKSLGEGLERLGNMPPVVDGADEGGRLLERYMPGEDASAVVTTFDLDVAILIRAGRDNRLGITDAKEGGWVPGPHRPAVEESVAGLQAGDRMLVDEKALDAFRTIRRVPATDDGDFLAEDQISVIQAFALRQIGARFDLEVIARGSDGLSVVELVPRGEGGPSGVSG